MRQLAFRALCAGVLAISVAGCGGSDSCSDYSASYHFTFDGNGDFGQVKVDCDGKFAGSGSGWFYTGQIASDGSVSGTCGCNGGPCGTVFSGTFAGSCPTTSSCFGPSGDCYNWSMSR